MFEPHTDPLEFSLRLKQEGEDDKTKKVRKADHGESDTKIFKPKSSMVWATCVSRWESKFSDRNDIL